MKIKLFALVFCVSISSILLAQSQFSEEFGTSGTLTYQYVKNDPTNTRIYTLANGLKVYLSKSTEMPRMQTCIAVRTGSKNDPADATGLAHYLEHMLFKGTDKYGSKDYEKEKVLLEAIENTYEVYRNTKDVAKRKAIYHTIDSLSGEAAKFAIANEYDKMCTEMGMKGTNAFTSTDVTCYINDVPVNQLEKWCMLETERFRNPVMRLFHTELEAVYEEKNIGMDRDINQCYEMVLSSLFQKHGYGTKTTIGTVEHLKNPSIKEIRKYFEKYYVANNMALCIAGDIDYDKTIAMIEKHFGTWKSGKENTQMTFPNEDPITAPILKDYMGPEEERVLIGYRTPPAALKKHNLALKLINKMLYNGVAGMIDLDLVQKQKVLEGFAFIEQWNDYGIFVFGAKPMPGTNLEDVKNLLLAEVEKVKKGEFSDDLLKAIANNLAKEDYQKFESYSDRAYFMVDAFIQNQAWIDIIQQSEEIRNLKREFVMQVANMYFQNNYVCISKKTGEREPQNKVEKPAITPVSVNREDKSPFLQNMISQKVSEVAPKFIDLQNDLQKSEVKPGMMVKSVKNTVNPLFNLEYVWKLGKLNAAETAFAADYLQYLGTKAMKAENLKMKMYELACSYYVDASDNELRIGIEGIDGNMEKATALLDELLQKAVGDPAALENMISGILQERADERKNKGAIRQALTNFGLYGKDNKYTARLTEAQMKAMKPADLVKKVQGLSGIKHDVYYYGPRENKAVADMIAKTHNSKKSLADAPPVKRFAVQGEGEPTVFFVDYDMKQAELVWTVKGDEYKKELMPEVRLFNEYFGGGMSGVVFQTIRESKALAYSTYSVYRQPYTKEEPFTMFAYVGTQADKISEAAPAMIELLNDLPNSANMFDMAKKSIQNSIETERITKQNIIYQADMMERLGLTEDIRKSYYERIPKMTYQDLRKFSDTHVKDKKYNIMVLGSKDKVDFKVLEKYGKVVKLNLNDVFGESDVKP
jgi:predicted Zn-dependent peptidase